MRKYIVGFLVGLLVASAFPAYGAVTSLIGQQVKGENVVIVNGVKLEEKSVNVNGKTYAPNRAIADALDMNISFIDGTVIFENKQPQSGGGSMATETPTPTHNFTLETIESAIESQNGTIEAAQAGINLLEKNGADPIKIAELKAGMQSLYDELSRLKGIKSELEAQN